MADRVSENLDRMGLTYSRIWISYRARAIEGIKANYKRSWKNDLLQVCDDKILETHEHLPLGMESSFHYFFRLGVEWHSIPAGMEWSFHSGRN